MDIRPTALNIIIIGLASIVFNFVWRMLAGWVNDRNPELAGAMGALA